MKNPYLFAIDKNHQSRGVHVPVLLPGFYWSVGMAARFQFYPQFKSCDWPWSCHQTSIDQYNISHAALAVWCPEARYHINAQIKCTPTTSHVDPSTLILPYGLFRMLSNKFIYPTIQIDR